MPEYINLNPVIREISDVQNNILLLNGKMDTMGAQVGAVTQDLNTTRQKLPLVSCHDRRMPSHTPTFSRMRAALEKLRRIVK